MHEQLSVSARVVGRKSKAEGALIASRFRVFLPPAVYPSTPRRPRGRIPSSSSPSACILAHCLSPRRSVRVCIIHAASVSSTVRVASRFRYFSPRTRPSWPCRAPARSRLSSSRPSACVSAHCPSPRRSVCTCIIDAVLGWTTSHSPIGVQHAPLENLPKRFARYCNVKF